MPSSPLRQIEALYGQSIRPERTLSQDDQRRFDVARRVIDQNYYELSEYIDGDLETNPIFICHRDQREEEGFEALRLVHNHLAALYSYNETVRVLFDRYTPDAVHLAQSDFTPNTAAEEESHYGKQLAFLRGLRTDFQHGGFSSFQFSKVGELGDFGGYHVEFNRQRFVEESGLRDPESFLRHSNDAQRQYPLCYIGRFHTQTLNGFHTDTQEWFNTAP